MHNTILEKNNIPTLNDIHLLYKKITELLIAKKITLTTMESCTSGFIASLITDTEGASQVLKGACVAYSNEAKVLNGVNESIIQTKGVYSIETAQEMVKAIQKKFSSDIAIGVTGTFGNIDLNNVDSVSGEVYFAISYYAKITTKKILLPQNIRRFESKLYVANEIGKAILNLI